MSDYPRSCSYRHGPLLMGMGKSSKAEQPGDLQMCCKGWPNIILNPMDPGWDVTQGICAWRQNPFCLTKCVMFFGVCFFLKILFHVVNP